MRFSSARAAAGNRGAKLAKRIVTPARVLTGNDGAPLVPCYDGGRFKRCDQVGCGFTALLRALDSGSAPPSRPS